MGLKDYAKKKLVEKVGERVALGAIARTMEYAENKSKKDSETTQTKQKKTNDSSSFDKTVSEESFFEEKKGFYLTMSEKIVYVRKSYVITDASGNVIYTAKSEGLPKMPEFGLYDNDFNRIGEVEKGIWGNPIYTLTCKERTIASLHSRPSLKLKFEIPENGWRVEIGIAKTVVYDRKGAIAIQIKQTLPAKRDTLTIEYLNKDNEVPAVLFALVTMMVIHMG